MIGAALFLALAGCVVERETFMATQKQVEDQTPFRQVSLASAWVNAPGMEMVVQRGLLYGSEQRISLDNNVAMPGDNMLVIRSRKTVFGATAGRLRYEEFMSRIGGAPTPFKDLTPGELRMGEDSLGSYFWTSRPAGADITCVFGMRRLSSGIRTLPGDANAMDIMLRNCIRGTPEQALLPIMDASVGVRRGAGTSTAGGNTRLLSPLAAPSLPSVRVVTEPGSMMSPNVMSPGLPLSAVDLPLMAPGLE